MATDTVTFVPLTPGSVVVKGEDNVGTPLRAYNWMAGRWELSNSLMGGTDDMKEAGRKFLPQYAKEKNKDYESRLAGAVLTNVFKKTVVNLSNKPLTETPKFDENLDARMQEWLTEDIDLEGNDVAQFSKELIKDALVAGKTHILAEYPRQNEGEVLTLADVRERNLRPYLVHIKASDVIGWRSKVIAGVRVLTQLRVKSNQMRDIGSYGQKMVQVITVYAPGTWEVHELNTETKKWVMMDNGVTSLDYIPLTTVYFNKVDFMVSEPTLGDLAHLNNHHWNSQADQNHALRIARIPLMFGKMLGDGVDPATGEKVEVEVSPNSLVIGNNQHSELSYVEHSGKALEAGRDDLQKTLEIMEAFSMQLLIPRTGDQTATEKSIDTAAANSDLQSMVEALEDGMQNAMKDMAALDANIDPESIEKPSYFKEFSLKVGSIEEGKLLLESANSGQLSQETYLTELDRRGFFKDGFNAAAEQDRISNQAPALTGDPLVLDDEDDDAE